MSRQADADALTPAAYHILLALTDGEQHGYRIMGEVERASGGKVRLGPGTLYRTLDVLRTARLIREVSRRESTGTDPRRRYYALTAEGGAALARETRHMADVVRLARARGVLKMLPGAEDA